MLVIVFQCRTSSKLGQCAVFLFGKKKLFWPRFHGRIHYRQAKAFSLQKEPLPHSLTCKTKRRMMQLVNGQVWSNVTASRLGTLAPFPRNYLHTRIFIFRIRSPTTLTYIFPPRFAQISFWPGQIKDGRGEESFCSLTGACKGEKGDHQKMD